MYFNETYHDCSLTRPHYSDDYTDDIFKVMDSKVKVTDNIIKTALLQWHTGQQLDQLVTNNTTNEDYSSAMNYKKNLRASDNEKKTFTA